MWPRWCGFESRRSPQARSGWHEAHNLGGRRFESFPRHVICGKCGDEKPEESFAPRSGRPTRQSYCRDCQRAYRRSHYEANHEKYKAKAKAWREDQKRKFVAWLETQSCADCGIDDHRLLDLDHVRGDKVMNVSKMIGTCSDKALWEEVDKCDVVCANCHRLRTAERGDWYEYLRV